MKKNEDHKLGNDILGMEPKEFDQLFLTHYPMLFHYGKAFSLNEQLVEDSIQELFIHLYEKNIKLTTIQNIKAYLFTALRRRILEKKLQTNKANSLEISSENEFSIEDLLIKKEEKIQNKQLLATHLANLPWRQKEAVYLKFFNNLSAKEIGEIMGITTQVVSNTVYKAIKKLKEIATKSVVITIAATLNLLQF